MEHHRFLLQLLLLLSAICCATSAGSSQNDQRYVRVLIDCGASQSTAFNDSDRHTYQWLTDGNFTNAGENFLFNSSALTYPMNSLRFFPSGRKNCYDFSFYYSSIKFLFRAGFYYGNYDGLSRPPRFNLMVEGHFWATVDTSLSQEEPVYYELVYKLKRDSARVCLERTEEDQVPFISSLEVTVMDNELYRLMENDTALFLHSRTNYGANKTIEGLIGFHEECCGRKWKPKEMTEYLNIHADIIPTGSFYNQENMPPRPVLAAAIQVQNNISGGSINLPVDFSWQSKSNLIAYFVLYFKDPVVRNPYNKTSKIDIYVDDTKFDTIDVPSWIGSGDNIRVVSLYPVPVNGTATVVISPANGTELPPLLNAMEVFSVIDVSKAGYSRHNLVAWCFILFNFLYVIFYLYV